jgi:hypothetical protein
MKINVHAYISEFQSKRKAKTGSSVGNAAFLTFDFYNKTFQNHESKFVFFPCLMFDKNRTKDFSTLFTNITLFS